MTEQDKITWGLQAAALLNNEQFEKCLDRLEEEYTKAWKAGRTIDARENAFRYVSLLSRLKEDLTAVITTGTISQKRVAELRDERSLRRIW